MKTLHSTQQKFNELVKQMDTLHLSEDGTLKGGILIVPQTEASANLDLNGNCPCNQNCGSCGDGREEVPTTTKTYRT